MAVTLKTETVAVKAGIEYTGALANGNSVTTTKEVGVSINRTPFGIIPKNEKFFLVTDFTYAFDKDTTLWVSNEITPDYDVITNGTDVNDVVLVDAVESFEIATASDPVAITKGSVSCSCFIQSTSNQNETVIIKIETVAIGNIFTSTPITIPAKSSGTTAYGAVTIDTTPEIAADAVVGFTVTAQGTGLTIKGTIEPSRIKLTRSI